MRVRIHVAPNMTWRKVPDVARKLCQTVTIVIEIPLIVTTTTMRHARECRQRQGKTWSRQLDRQPLRLDCEFHLAHVPIDSPAHHEIDGCCQKQEHCHDKSRRSR